MELSHLSWPFFEESHRQLAERLEAWCRERLGGHGQEWRGEALDERCRALVGLLANGGWLNYAAPGEGRAIDLRSLCLIRETLARFDPIADFAFAMQGLGSGSVSLFGSDSLQERLLPDVRAGKAVAAFAISEPGAGSDVAAMQTVAAPESGGYRVSGIKTLISNAGIADCYTLFAALPDGAGGGKRRYVALLIPADAPGLAVSRRIEAIAPHPLGELTLNDVRVPNEMRIGEEGDGLKIALATLDLFRTTVGAAALGMARRAMAEALAHAHSRMMYGRAQVELQLIQAKLAEMATSIDASALLIYRAAWSRDIGGERITKAAAMAKLYATEEAQKTIDAAVQILGGLGVVAGSVVESLYREIRPLRIYEGASEVQLQVIARQLRAEFEQRSDR